MASHVINPLSTEDFSEVINMSSLDSPNADKTEDDCGCQENRGRISECSALRNEVGTTLSFRDLRVSVPVKKPGMKGTVFGATTGEYKDILCGVSGICAPGELIYLMGPSGSGKTTLLDVLADRVSLPIRGTQFINEQVKTERELKKQAKYVQQHDVLFGALTTRETITYSAKFYEPDAEKRKIIVDQTLDVLGLIDHQNVKIGNIFFRGLSGGQQRRVSVGCELVAKPAILFLDEPTSGLDSTTAFQLMSVLKGLARESNTAIICSIHQPSHSVFALADKLMLLSKGRQMYFGPTADIAPYFEGLGFNFPEHVSVAEWIIDLVNTDYAQNVKNHSVEKCAEAWPASALNESLIKQLECIGLQQVPDPGPEGDTKSGVREHVKDGLIEYKTSLLSQTITLTDRGFNNMGRDPSAMWLRMLMYFALAVMIGTVWLRIPQNVDQIQNLAGMLFFVTAFTIFMSIAVLPAYIAEQAVFVKEKANGSYRVLAFTLSNMLVGTPFMLLMSLMIAVTVYWLVGLRNTVEAFFIFVAAQFLALMVAESMMFFVSAIFPMFIVGIAASAFTYGLFMIVQGFFISLTDIGWWWRWAQWISLHFYAFNIMFQNQFAPGEVYAASPPMFPNDWTGEYIQEFYGFGSVSIGVSFGALVAMVFVYRILATSFLFLFFRGKK